MANSKDGLGHKDKYLDTSRKNAHVQYDSFYNYYLEVKINVNFKKMVKCQGQKV